MSDSFVLTGNQVYIYQWLARKGACKLEAKGLGHSSGRSVRAMCKRELGLKRTATLEEICEAIDIHCDRIANGEIDPTEGRV